VGKAGRHHRRQRCNRGLHNATKSIPERLQPAIELCRAATDGARRTHSRIAGPQQQLPEQRTLQFERHERAFHSSDNVRRRARRWPERHGFNANADESPLHNK
jgi:hypothetical protein